MATEYQVVCLTRVAGADLSAAQYKFVEMSSAGTVTVCNTAGEGALGVLQNDPTSGQTATIAYEGVSKVVAGDTVAIAGKVSTDNAGRAIPATTGHKILGVAMSGGAVGQIISVLLKPETAVV